MDELLKYKIAITLIKGVGPMLAKRIIATTGSVEKVFVESQKALEKIPGIGTALSSEIVVQRNSALERAESEVRFILKNGIKAYYFLDNEYPFRLKECADSPVMLYGKGNLNFNKGNLIAVVGTRKATDAGKENTKKLVFDVARDFPDSVIVSGLAYGIDICAHKVAIEAGVSTIGVLGHGLDRIYPSMHAFVADKMLQSGGLLTEFVSRTNPDKPNFVQRNRIVAGMCDAVVVVESAQKGGALITANLANDYNRDVFAFPGRVNDESSAGCNNLIKYNKSALIESAEDLFRFMNWERVDRKPNSKCQTSLFHELSDEEHKLLIAIEQCVDGIQVNELAALSALPFSKVSSLLLELEFKNLVKCLPGNVYKLIR